MIRTQLQLDEDIYREIKILAYEQGKSMSAVVREILKRELGDPGSRKKKKKLTMADFPWVGKYKSGKSDISEKHDLSNNKKKISESLKSELITFINEFKIGS